MDGFNDYFFSTEGIINDEHQEDIWSIYKVCGEFDCYQSLDHLLYSISFDSTNLKKQYQVDHGEFYNMLQRNKGMKHLATLMLKICQFLQKLREIDMVYGNLRPENILIKFDRFKSRIESIKLIDFGSTTEFDCIH